MIDVVAIGELLIDFSEECKNKDNYSVLSGHPGGAPANFLAPISKFGLKTSLISNVGNDSFGKELVNTLKENKIGVKNISFDNGAFTTLAFVTLDKKGDRSFSFSRKPGADTRIKYSNVNLKEIDECRVFHFGTLSLTDNPSRETTYKLVNYAKKKGKLISFDPNLREPLWSSLKEAKKQMLYGLRNSNIVKISDNEIKFLFNIAPKKSIDYMLKKFPNIELLYVTCGENGCYFSTKRFKSFVPSLKGIKVVDTTGAGDIFGGSAMYKFLSLKKDIESLEIDDLFDIVKFASTSAGLSTTKSGGLKTVPSYNEIIRIYRRLEK